MLSYQRMGVPQAGQWLPGHAMEKRRGPRQMTTLKKLPQIVPKRKAKAAWNRNRDGSSGDTMLNYQWAMGNDQWRKSVDRASMVEGRTAREALIP